MSFDDDDYHYQDRISASREPEDLFTHDEPKDLVKRLTQAWINERAAPEILKYESDCVSGLVAKCDDQVLKLLFYFCPVICFRATTNWRLHPIAESILTPFEPMQKNSKL